MKNLLFVLFILAGPSVFTQQFPELDVRSTNDVTDGASLQLATPSESNFLRLFSGRQGNNRPHLFFSRLDTFRIFHGNADFTNISERMTFLPQGDVIVHDLAGVGDRSVLVDSDGRLKAQISAGISFQATLIEDTTLLSATESLIGNWNAFGSEASKNFDEMSGIYTVQAAGVYLFHVKFAWGRDVMDLDDIPIVSRWLVNGSVFGGSQKLERVTIDNSYGDDTEYSWIVRLQAGDEVQISATAVTSGPNIILKGGSSSGSSTLSGFRIE